MRQDRAVEAISFALGMQRPHYNIYASGPTGTGRHELVERLLKEDAAMRPAGNDWCYVYNFQDSLRPDVISLPAGRGSAFHTAMEHLVRDLQSALGAAFTNEEYRNNAQSLQDAIEQQQNTALDEVRLKAEDKNIAMLHTPMGYGFAPLRDSKVMPPEDFNALPKEERQKIEEIIRSLQEDLRAAMQKMPVLLQQTREKVRALNEETAELAVGHLIESLINDFGDLDEVVGYLRLMHKDVTANVDLFLMTSGATGGPYGGQQPMGRQRETDFFRRYQVNLIVDQGTRDNAPVIYEDEPTFERLIGRIEHVAEMGTLFTDFNLIRGGALHRANGGYLILDARKVLAQPMAWEALKRALQAGEIRIEPLYSALGLPSTTTLEPEPVPLSIKIVLVGESIFYCLLHQYDADFGNLFKIQAYFDEQTPRSDETVDRLATTIASTARQEKLHPFDRESVARLIDDAVRGSGDSERLSTNMERLTDLMREADYLAGEAGLEIVDSASVTSAIDARTRRSQRISDRMQEAMARETIQVDSDGKKVGQVNGLAVFSMGVTAFGKPSRITARVRVGQGNVVDIEREVELGGPLHSKGVLILSGYLGAQYAQEKPLSLTASLVFEQSYGGVDGDSASSAELYALLSAIAEVPLAQHYAVTGSINQHGEVQAIGGVNEKIEGFFDLCAERGLTGDQGVLIPEANIKHLMLHPRVVEAAAAGKFHIYPVATVEQGIELLTGMNAGEKDADGAFPDGSFNARVADRLGVFATRRRQFARPEKDGETS